MDDGLSDTPNVAQLDSCGVVSPIDGECISVDLRGVRGLNWDAKLACRRGKGQHAGEKLNDHNLRGAEPLARVPLLALAGLHRAVAGRVVGHPAVLLALKGPPIEQNGTADVIAIVGAWKVACARVIVLAANPRPAAGVVGSGPRLHPLLGVCLQVMRGLGRLVAFVLAAALTSTAALGRGLCLALGVRVALMLPSVLPPPW